MAELIFAAVSALLEALRAVLAGRSLDARTILAKVRDDLSALLVRIDGGQATDEAAEDAAADAASLRLAAAVLADDTQEG